MSQISNKLKNCRICGSEKLENVIDFGELSLTGVFLDNGSDVKQAPLHFNRCGDCGLVQLGHNYLQSELYGASYGYESHLNQTMVHHLKQKARVLERKYLINNQNYVVVDIASNDGTLLSGSMREGLVKVGIDPLIDVVSNYYPNNTIKVKNFFSASEYWKNSSDPANLITSLSMLYDLEDPVGFARQINEILIDGGIWHFEQSYLPMMIKTKSYDTICHEHVEYYSLKVLKKLFENQNLKIIDVSLNSINGGSFAITVVHKDSSFKVKVKEIDQVLERENRMQLNTLKPYKEFKDRVYKHREDLTSLIRSLNLKGKKVAGYGASTKGNVLLQFCGFTESDIACIAEVNEDKFGSYTPGSLIPILSESQVMSMNPDYLLVLPWHFKDTIIMKNQKFLADGGKFIFPLPDIEIV